ncbi:hypothetical protein HYU21_02860 [Candidatus Woesearchaeota archaeon]|nr:hypothetical protein [Candidatus Woesearchaeota archaeon]
MTVKNLLGIESSPLSEMEVMERLDEAQRRGWRVLELPLNKSGNLTKKIILSRIEEKGVMKDYEGLYVG